MVGDGGVAVGRGVVPISTAEHLAALANSRRPSIAKLINGEADFVTWMDGRSIVQH